MLFNLTTKTAKLCLISLAMLISGCRTSSSGGGGAGGGDPYDPILHGTISYPFMNETSPIGRSQPQDKFVIKSQSGGTQYTIEIPGEARDFDVEIPIAELGNLGKAGNGVPQDIQSPQLTDREMVGALPRIGRGLSSETALMDSAFGVARKGGSRQGPSYTLGITKVNSLYKKRNYNYALIEINHMLAFYPNSPKLYKMKGTILVKLRSHSLAAQAWTRAAELAPRDLSLKKGLQRLNRRITAERREAIEDAVVVKSLRGDSQEATNPLDGEAVTPSSYTH